MENGLGLLTKRKYEKHKYHRGLVAEVFIGDRSDYSWAIKFDIAGGCIIGLVLSFIYLDGE